MYRLMVILILILLIAGITSCGGAGKEKEPGPPGTFEGTDASRPGEQAGAEASNAPYREDSDLGELFGAEEEVERMAKFRDFGEMMGLVEQLGDEDGELRMKAFTELAGIGKDAVPVLIQGLKNVNPDVRIQATAILARLGPDAAPAVGALIIALDDPEGEGRKGAAVALGRIGAASKAALPKLGELAEKDEFAETVTDEDGNAQIAFTVRAAALKAVKDIETALKASETPADAG